jgi:hypothetical protein
VNLTEMPPGWYVGLSLPDGRVAIADAENPAHAAAVAAIRRRDYEAAAAWLDQREPLPAGQLFAWEEKAA